ncbi:MAG TPA: hypothetical protein VEC02_01270 [Nitrososphaerales archaeon]|nr:hypothetical protein [Nitrososphaerales archaeon]
MRSSVVAVTLAILVAGSLGAGYLAGVGNRQTITSTAYSLSTSTSTSIQTVAVTSTRTHGTTVISVTSSPYPFLLESARSIHSLDYNASNGGYLVFNLTVRNMADVPVYIWDSCSTSLGLSVIPSSGAALVRNPYGSSGCALMATKAIQPGAMEYLSTPLNHPSIIMLVRTGTFVANLTLSWGWNSSSITHSTTFFVPFTVGGSPIPVANVETANITIGGTPGVIAVNPDSGRIYVEDDYSRNLTVVDASTHSLVATVTLPAMSDRGIAIDYHANMVYVLVEGGIAEVNGSTNKVAGELQVDLVPGALAYDPAARVIYGATARQIAANNYSGSLLGFDVRTGSLVANISLGFWAWDLAIDPLTHMVYAVGCTNSFLCFSEASFVNGTSRSVVNTLNLGADAIPTVAVNPKTNVVYLSGVAQLMALNGTNGKTIYEVNPQTCVFSDMSIIQSSDQVLATSFDYNYVLVYDGASGVLVNMYSLTKVPSFGYFGVQDLAFNPNTGEVYVTISTQLLAFHSVAATGNVNSTLVYPGQYCPPP